MANTLENLQAAYNGESNARAKYLAFAQKADQEGYPQVARLFRAAAEAEAIHAAFHARVITQAGAKPVCDIKPVTPATTAENLKVAIAGESYERDVMYPDFIKQAQAEGNKMALMGFQGALAAEAQHAALYEDALKNLASRKGGQRDYWVCEVCGCTLEQAPADRCPVCKAPKEKFKKVN